MDCPRYRAAARVALVSRAALLLLPLVSPIRAAARVVEVGPQREARTIDAALARATVGDEIVLDRGAEFPTAGLRVTVDGIEIRAGDGPGELPVIRNTSTAKTAITVLHLGEGLILKDLVMTGGGTVTCIRGKGRRLTVENVHPAASIWRFVHLDGAEQTVIRDCTAPVLNDYTVCSFGGGARDLLIERCTFRGSVEEHCVRLHKIYDARLRSNTLYVGGKKSALTIREGENVRVENCTLNGPLAIGPLADGDGGINLPQDTAQQRAVREAMLRKSSADYTFKNCTIEGNGITVEMGVRNLVFDGCWIKTSKSWALRLNKDEYAPWRIVPTGRLVHCELTGPAGLRPFEQRRPDFHVIGTVVNGVRMPDTASPATQPGGGGAVPGEVPATNPTTLPTTQPGSPQVDVRVDDLIAALGYVDGALAQLNIARKQLRSTTQPSAVASAP